MKRVITAFLAVCLSLSAFAQPKAVGFRTGLSGKAGIGEVSYEHYFSLFGHEYDFIEGELGVWGSSGFKASALYNFTLFQPEWSSDGEWGIYAGPGAVLGYGAFVNNDDPSSYTGRPFLGLTAQAGIEYRFSFPLQLSLDIRPSYLLPASRNSIGWFGIALGLRYMFS